MDGTTELSLPLMSDVMTGDEPEFGTAPDGSDEDQVFESNDIPQVDEHELEQHTAPNYETDEAHNTQETACCDEHTGLPTPACDEDSRQPSFEDEITTPARICNVPALRTMTGPSLPATTRQNAAPVKHQTRSAKSVPATTKDHSDSEAIASSFLAPKREEELAAEINRLHTQIKTSTKFIRKAGEAVLENALKIGHALLEVKRSLRHGELEVWIRTHCDFCERTARNYMTVAKNEEMLTQYLEAAKRQPDAEIGLALFLKLLRDSGNSTGPAPRANAAPKTKSDRNADDEFLARIRTSALWQRLHDKAVYERDALLWWRLRSVCATASRVYAETWMGADDETIHPGVTTLFSSAVDFFIGAQPPEHWALCGDCQEDSTNDCGPHSCVRCGGAGYVVTYAANPTQRNSA